MATIEQLTAVPGFGGIRAKQIIDNARQLTAAVAAAAPATQPAVGKKEKTSKKKAKKTKEKKAKSKKEKEKKDKKEKKGKKKEEKNKSKKKAKKK